MFGIVVSYVFWGPSVKFLRNFLTDAPAYSLRIASFYPVFSDHRYNKQLFCVAMVSASYLNAVKLNQVSRRKEIMAPQWPQYARHLLIEVAQSKLRKLFQRARSLQVNWTICQSFAMPALWR